jgi:two-component system chemotaxis response regulator CheB
MAKNLLTRAIDLVVVGGSAGSLDVILKILPQLRTGHDFSIILVMHRKNTYDFSLSDLLATKTSWVVSEAEEKQVIQPDRIYLAPADYHLLIENDHSLSLDVSEKVHYSRPSIDVTFEAAAEAFHDRVAAVLLSGANEDGVDGLRIVKANGGLTIVQDPETAAVAYMPQQAINRLQIDQVLAPAKIAEAISNMRGSLSAKRNS